jgi:phosphopantetheine adenylyltransferase
MNIPIVDNNGNLQSFGSEFKQIYQMNLSNNLMNPEFRQTDYNTGRAVADYRNDGGLPNQNLLYSNSNNPDALIPQTDKQALDNVIDGRTNLSEKEKAMLLYTRNNYDPSLRKNLILDSNATGSNMYSRESQDYVKEAQTSYTNYKLEEELLTLFPGTKATYQGVRQQQQQKKITPFQQGIDVLLDQARQQQKQQEESQKFRDRMTGNKPTPTQSQRFRDRMKGAPFQYNI